MVSLKEKEESEVEGEKSDRFRIPGGRGQTRKRRSFLLVGKEEEEESIGEKRQNSSSPSGREREGKVPFSMFLIREEEEGGINSKERICTPLLGKKGVRKKESAAPSSKRRC